MRPDIITGATPTCVYCRQIVVEVQDPYSFVLDYGSEFPFGGMDYGCDSHPLSDEEGTYGHTPIFHDNYVGQLGRVMVVNT
jgi:hypothetical protein